MIRSLASLRTLDISFNQVNAQQLHEMLQHIESLTELLVEHNPLRFLPVSINRHQQLRVFKCGYCQLQMIDSLQLEVLSLLQVLDVSNNQLTLLPSNEEWQHLQAIEFLSVENNSLKDLPICWGQLPQLRTLLISGNPQRIVRTQIIQQGSAKVIDYLRDRSGPVISPPETVFSSAAFKSEGQLSEDRQRSSSSRTGGSETDNRARRLDALRKTNSKLASSRGFDR